MAVDTGVGSKARSPWLILDYIQFRFLSNYSNLEKSRYINTNEEKCTKMHYRILKKKSYSKCLTFVAVYDQNI